MSPSLDFGVPLTGIDSAIPGWDASLEVWNEFCLVRQSVSDHKLLIAPTTTTLLFYLLFSVLNQGLVLAVTYLLF